MKNTNIKNKPVEGRKRAEMSNTTSKSFKSKLKRFTGLVWATLLLLAYAPACRTIQYVPIETGTTVNVKDSTVINIKDSVRIIEATRYKDMAWLGDSLKIEGARSRMWAVADTTREAIIGELQESAVEEKTRIIYRDRWKTRDSLVIKEVPVEVTKEVKVVPKFWRITGVFGIVCLVLLLVLAGWKIYQLFKGKGIFPLP